MLRKRLRSKILRKKKQNEDSVTEEFFQWGRRKNESNIQFEDKDLGSMTLNNYMSSGVWCPTIRGHVDISYMGKKMNIPFTYNYGQYDKNEFASDNLQMYAVITDKARANFRKIVKGWMNTSSCMKRLKELFLGDDRYYDYGDENINHPRASNPPSSNSDFLKIYPPIGMELYPNGTLLLYVKDLDYTYGDIVILAPKVEIYPADDTDPATIAYTDSKPSIDEVSANYEKNKSFVTFL